MAHTKGKWFVLGKYTVVHGEAHNYIPVCDVAPVNMGNDEPDGEDNARLIAAAPELLEALRQVMEQLDIEGLRLPKTLDLNVTRLMAKAKRGETLEQLADKETGNLVKQVPDIF